MPKPSKAVMAFMEKYGVESDEIWEAHGSWVVLHKALERIAVEVGIVWLRPSVQLCDLAAKTAVICAFGKLGEREEWSFGEASPANNKNNYPVAMAEKRARDRVILKLLVTHGALYSESEADEFAQPGRRQNPPVPVLTKEMQRIQGPQELSEWRDNAKDIFDKRPNPHVTRAEDIHDEISDDIKPGDPQTKMKVKAARTTYPALIKEMLRIQDPQELFEWGQAMADEIHALPGEWPAHFKGEYTKHKKSITNGAG
jgi:hypothetical protein